MVNPMSGRHIHRTKMYVICHIFLCLVHAIYRASPDTHMLILSLFSFSYPGASHGFNLPFPNLATSKEFEEDLEPEAGIKWLLDVAP